MRRIASICLPLLFLLTACPDDETNSDGGPANDDAGSGFADADLADASIECGNGLIETAELCDDGNTVNGDGCTDTCTIEQGWSCTGEPSLCTLCGDGLVDAPEVCDDQNTTAGDGCDATCAIEAGWMCTGEPSACTTICPDGIRAGPEGCDDNNNADGDGCSAMCSVEPGWECVGLMPDTCDTLCGDGLIIGAETCDDANTAIDDGCDGNCTIEPGWTCTSTPSACTTVCGDTLVVGTEECDDGNLIDADDCEANCTLPVCGNSITDTVGAEECDDGNAFNGDGCDNNCTFPGCGNGIIDIGETCDDGNLIAGDGCEPDCTPTGTCGNGVLEIGEQCDDGNLAPRDGCSPLCKTEACGDGVMDAGEECDDGNLLGGDGCSSACLLELIASTNVVSAGFGGIRDVGTGTITLAGVTGPVSRALLYWHGPTNLSDATANSTVTFAGTQIYGTNIGFSADNCWNYQNSQAYRADVTSLVTGDGSYALADFFKAGANTNGVSLLVFFDDGDPMNNSNVYLFDGNDSNINNPYDGANWLQTYGGMMYSGTGTVTVELHVADGQAFPDEAVDINALPFILGGQNWEGDSVPNGPSAPNTSGGLWDIKTFSVTGFFTAGTNTLTLTTPGVASDCLSLIASIFIVPVP